MATTVLPGINAALNLLSALLLVSGFVAIRRRAVHWHRGLMLAAVASSALFLAGYLTRLALTGVHRFPIEGAIKSVYLAVLGSHMLLAALVVPLLFWTLYLAGSRRFRRHRRIARVTWPSWLYVSVTGIAVYVLLYQVAPHLALPPP